MAEHNTLAQEMEDIFDRLKELDKLNFPQYRTYQRPDGTWVDREPVPEYLEQEELIHRWQEIQKIERYFHREHNSLLISLRLWCIANSLKDEPEPQWIFLCCSALLQADPRHNLRGYRQLPLRGVLQRSTLEQFSKIKNNEKRKRGRES